MGAKIDYKGTVKTMNNGQKAEVIEYINSKNMTIQFEDGTIVEGVKKVHFDAGKVSTKKNEYAEIRIGETNIMNNGLIATIIDYKNANDITVQFDSGEIVYNRRYAHFLSGRISLDTLDYSNRKNSCKGETRMMKCGMKATCIDYINTHNITVQFEDGEIVYNKSKNVFYDGAILHPGTNRSYYCNNADEHLNKRKQMNCGEFCTIIEYNTCDDITVKFDSGEIVRHRTLGGFDKGSIDSTRAKLKFRSLPQMICYYFIKYYFSDAQMDLRPAWLKNDRTGASFELDIYIPQLKIAIEYDGYNMIHCEKTNNEDKKYNLIYKNSNIDKMIVIYEPGCIRHKEDRKLVEYFLESKSIISEYANFIEKLLYTLHKILTELGVKDNNLNNILSFKSIIDNYDENRVYNYNEIKLSVVDKILELEELSKHNTSEELDF